MRLLLRPRRTLVLAAALLAALTTALAASALAVTASLEPALLRAITAIATVATWATVAPAIAAPVPTLLFVALMVAPGLALPRLRRGSHRRLGSGLWRGRFEHAEQARQESLARWRGGGLRRRRGLALGCRGRRFRL